MRQLLRVLAQQLLFLLAPGRYMLSGSESSESFENAWISLRGDNVEWLLIRDRDQVFLDCRPGGTDGEWFSIDLLVRLLSGERTASSVLTPEYARWLEDHLDEIEARFASDRVEGTVGQLQAAIQGDVCLRRVGYDIMQRIEESAWSAEVMGSPGVVDLVADVGGPDLCRAASAVYKDVSP